MNRCYFRLDKLVVHKCRNLPEVPFWTPGKNRPPPRAQAEIQLSALYPGKRAENSDPSLATEKGRKLPKIRPRERCKKKFKQIYNTLPIYDHKILGLLCKGFLFMSLSLNESLSLSLFWVRSCLLTTLIKCLKGHKSL